MRPTYHFTAERGWINDPHGVTYIDGRYHLFFQFVPDSLEWAPSCHWGHATSGDLFSFEHHPIALAPGDGDDGIWTGCVVRDGDDATAFYTAVSTPDFGIGRVRAAVATDAAWNDWAKGDVVVEAPPGLNLIAFRDPFVLREGEGWRMFVGAATTEGSAAALTYVSGDLASWAYDGIAASRRSAQTEPVWTGDLWECPQIFEIDGRHVLLVSVWTEGTLHYAAYAVGRLDGGRFTAQSWGRLTYGTVYYAPTFFRDAEGRPALMFWLRDVRDAAEGWTGAHSLPHLLRLDGDRLVAEPHPGLDDLHRESSTPTRVDGLAADATWTGSRLRVLSGGDVVVSFERRDGAVVIDVGGVPHEVPAADPSLRVILDGPIVEVFTGAGIFSAVIAPRGDALELDADGELALRAVAP